MQEHVINIGPTGHTHALYKEGMDLTCLGPMKVHRASDLVFDEEHQCWNVVPIDTRGVRHFNYVALSNFPSYEAARKFEVRWLNACLLHSMDPYSQEGLRRFAQEQRRVHAIQCS